LNQRDKTLHFNITQILGKNLNAFDPDFCVGHHAHHYNSSIPSFPTALYIGPAEKVLKLYFIFD